MANVWLLSQFHRWMIGLVLAVGVGGLLLLMLPQRVNAQGNGTISGTIYENDGFTPVTANARVDVYTINRAHVASVQANSNGTYAVSVPPGNYFVSAVAVGRALEFYENQGSSWSNSPSPVPVLAGANTAGINFRLKPGGTISGVVRDSAGQPLTSTNVALADSWVGGTCTDANGNYTLYNLSLDTPYRISAGGADNWCVNGPKHYFKEWYWQSTSFDDATPVTVTGGNPNQTGIHFSLQTGAVISGTIYAADGVTPLTSSAWVAAIDVTTHSEAATASVNTDGSYTLLVPTGQYRVYAAATGRALEFYNNTPYQDAATVISAAAGGTTTGIHFSLDAGGTISGIVTDSVGQPLANINVGLDNSWIGTCTDANGQYTLNHVSLNVAYTVSAGGNNWCPGGSSYFVQEWWQEAGSFIMAAPVTLAAGTPHQTGINFTLEPGGTVSGTIRDSITNQPLANFNVDVFVGLHSAAGVCTDASGNYTMTIPLDTPVRVAAGYYDWCGGQTNYVPQYWQGATTWENAALITATSVARDVLAVNFALDQGGRISGSVTAAEDSAPLEAVWVCAYAFTAPTFDTGEAPRCAQTQPDGTYLVSGIAPGNKRVWVFPDDRLRLFYDNAGGSATFEGAAPVSVTAGGTTTDIHFALPLAAIITGTIYEADGITPLEGVTISTENGEYPECTQPDGSYRLFVPAGTHIIRAGEGMCNGSVHFPTQYYDSLTDPASATPVTVAVGDTVANIHFINQASAGDAPAGLQINGNLTLPPIRPAFHWRHIIQLGETGTPAEWYALAVVEDNAIIMNHWFPAAQVCSGLACVLIPDSDLLPVGLLNGEYRWWVLAWGSGDFSEWSAEANFSVNVPAPAKPANLDVQPNQGRPSLTWTNDPNALWYQVYAGSENGAFLHMDWYEKTPGMCGGLTCTLTPFAHPTNGTYVYYLQAWGPGGFNEEDSNTWAGPAEITLDFDPPGLITPLTTTHASTGRPAFNWVGVPGATWYALWVGTAQHETQHMQWYPALDLGCTEPVTCSVIPDINLENGRAYTFYVQAWGPGGLSMGGDLDGWAGGETFTVSASLPGSPALTAPAGTISIANPAFVWSHLADVAWYEIELLPSVGAPLYAQWHPAEALGCREANTCALVVKGLFLPNGDYHWRVRAYSPAGTGSWSAAQGFTVNR